MVFSPIREVLLVTAGDLVVWRHDVVIPETAGSRAGGTFDSTYFIEHIGTKRSVVLAYGRQGRSAPEMATVLSDGTLWLRRDATIVYASPGHEPSEGSDNSKIVAAYPDGLILAFPEGRPEDVPSLHTLQWESLTAGGPSWLAAMLQEHLREDEHPEFKRAGNKIAWLADASDGKGKKLAPRQRMFVFDVLHRDVRPIGGDESPIVRISGFDAHRAFDGTKVIDVDTGKVSAVSEGFSQVEGYFGCAARRSTIGFVDGIVYLARETRDAYEVMGIPYDLANVRLPVGTRGIDGEKGPDPPFDLKALQLPGPIYRLEKSKLSRIPGKRRGELQLNVLFFVSDNVIRVWDGTTWIPLAAAPPRSGPPQK
jgi:hypothetical protein